MLEISNTLLPLIINLGYFGIFLGVVIGGEVLLVLAGALASLGYMKLWLITIIAVLGIVAHDVIWYLLGRGGRGSEFLKKIGKKFIDEEKYHIIEEKFKKRSVFVILFLRFVYGFRALSLIAAGVLKMGFKKFFFYTLLGSSFWAIIFVGLGYFFGNSLNFLTKTIKELHIVVPIFVALIIIVLVIIRFVKKALVKSAKIK